LMFFSPFCGTISSIVKLPSNKIYVKFVTVIITETQKNVKLNQA